VRFVGVLVFASLITLVPCVLAVVLSGPEKENMFWVVAFLWVFNTVMLSILMIAVGANP